VVAINAQRCAPGATPSQCATTTCNGSGQCPCTLDSDCSPGFVCNTGAPKVCVGAGAWPTGSQGATGASNVCSVTIGGSTAYDLSGNLQEWTSTPVTVVSGTTASIGTPSGGQVQINGLTGMLPSYVGAQLVLSNATNGANNGTFDVVSYVSTTQLVIANPAAVAQAGATVHWSLIYNKLRGGNYATTSPVGESCEFDFDIEKAAFVNNDVGFRCCADHAP
jgi:formylglycine-generating enzyme required for sulfatase activity